MELAIRLTIQAQPKAVIARLHQQILEHRRQLPRAHLLLRLQQLTLTLTYLTTQMEIAPEIQELEARKYAWTEALVSLHPLQIPALNSATLLLELILLI